MLRLRRRRERSWDSRMARQSSSGRDQDEVLLERAAGAVLVLGENVKWYVPAGTLGTISGRGK